MNKTRGLIIVGIVVAAVLISILLYTMLASHRLAITKLKAEAAWVTPLGSLNVTCNATAPRGDELSYNWSASGGKITGEGATVTWTAPLSSGSYNVTVTVTDGLGGEVMEWVTIEVRSNNPPTIIRLTANADWITPSGSIQLTCGASDPDGDELSYEWTASAGDISGMGAVVNWTASQEVGAYNVTVVVKDGYGGEDTEFVRLFVDLDTPPTIENLIVIAKEPKYLKTITNGYMVGRTKEYDIECKVSDNSSVVSYVWSCDGGEISGEGYMITWTAPNPSGSVYVTVTVVVSDVAGNMVSKSILFDVVSCSACTFG
jgi:hypothetical protein